MGAIFSIDPLNQKDDQNHKQQQPLHFSETKAERWNSKVSKGHSPRGFGFPKFVEYLEPFTFKLP